MDRFFANLVGDALDLGAAALSTSKSRGDDFLAVGIQELESLEIGTGSNLDDLCEAIADLRGR